MTAARAWWQRGRVKHRDAVLLCILSAAFLLAGELATSALRDIFDQYLAPVLSDPPQFLLRAILVVLAFTTSFGAVLVLLGGWSFLHGRIGQGRFLVGLGVGITSLILVSRLAYQTLVSGTPLTYLVPLATSLTGLGILFGVAAHTVMGQYALILKRRAAAVWRRWRRAHRPRRSS